MRFFFLFSVCAIALRAESRLYLSMALTKQYVVGAKLPPSGVFQKSAEGTWLHAGFNHPFVVAMDYDAADPSTLYLAAGNGLIRASDHGRKWTFLTGSDVTELRDVSVDHHSPGTIYYGYSNGIRVTHDGGKTWQELSQGLHRKFTEAIRVDRQHSGVLVAGGEEGVFRSEDEGKTWKLAGAAGYQILRIEQSPHDACYWLAATQQGGLFGSTDCGRSFESISRLGVGQNMYAISFDPTNAKRIAAAGWGPGVVVTDDGGKTWEPRNTGLPSTEITTVVFDPDHPNWIYAGVNEEFVFLSKDAGKTWSKDGLEGSAVTSMKFVPEKTK